MEFCDLFICNGCQELQLVQLRGFLAWAGHSRQPRETPDVSDTTPTDFCVPCFVHNSLLLIAFPPFLGTHTRAVSRPCPVCVAMQEVVLAQVPRVTA